jgi:signal transduction histidine kinase
VITIKWLKKLINAKIMKNNILNIYGELLIHDFRTILQNIKSSNELSSHYFDKPKEMKSFVEIIDQQVIRGMQLISNLQNLSEFDESKKNLQPIDVCKVLKKSIYFFGTSFQESKLKIDVDYSLSNLSPSNRIYVQANNLLQNLFENILFNAINYNINPCVEINVKISEVTFNKIQFVKLEFIDNGIGVHTARKGLIFQRGNEKHKGGKGAGLGLSLVKKIIESYKGHIWVEDKVKGDYSKGSNFIILIPVAH